MSTAAAAAPQDLARRREQILALADAGCSTTQIGEAFSISRARAWQILSEARAAVSAELAGDLELAALQLRYEHGLQLAPAVDEKQRFELLVAVIAPSRALLEASRQAALQRLNGEPATLRRSYGNCSGCGAPLAERTAGCRVCRDREIGRRKRQREREARQEQAA